jgi:hypothetical protein
MASDPLPVMATAEHLTRALHQAGVLCHNSVSSVVVESSRNMVLSQIRRLRLSYQAACDAPKTLILKTEHPERAGQGANGGRHEVEFYKGVAAAMSACLVPRCFEANWAPDTEAWHLLLEDLGDSHVIATQWPLPPNIAQCQSIMRARAKFQAEWWNDSRLGVSIGSQPDDEEIGQRVQRLVQQFASFADFMGDRLPRERVELFERWLDAAPLLLARAFNGSHRTIVHGDAHVWNCFLPRDGSSDDVRLFDWDSWRIGLGAIDLAYMMAVHWHPDLRQKRERLLLDDYHAALVAKGVGGYDRLALQTDYRFSVLWQIMTPVMQHGYGIPPVIWWNNLERVLLAVDDLDCRDFLG